MTPLALPFDTIGDIINFLTKDNANGLQYVKICSLVCQSFLPWCRTHIFSSITIKIAGSKLDERLHNTEAFGDLLLKTPEIGRFIRHLNIIIVDPRSKSRNLFDQVPQRLTRLQSLTVWRSDPRDVYDIHWNKMSSSMQCSLLNLVHLPTLTHLNLGWINNFPISDLISCTNLKHLSAEALYIVFGEHNDSALSHGHMQLQDLDIKIFKRSHGSELSLLTARRSDGRTVLDFSRLEKISVTFFVSEVAVQTREIFRMTQQLTEVHLKGKKILNV
jgi:hypothetical protein